ncbi:hypothetical protein SFC43_13210 [Bacteroides sp. CR5/BHMF/2]|nr:hypothetical protein [Bacteroides sp. CR5/BHMF/2]
MVLTPSLFVSGKGAADQITTVGNAAALTPGVKSGSAKWYKNGAAVTTGADGCTIGAASAKYALTIKTNHMSVSTPRHGMDLKLSMSMRTDWKSFPRRDTIHTTPERGCDHRGGGLCAERGGL